MNPVRPIVITSRAADKHFNDILQKHSEMVQGITAQKMRVDAYNQQKAVEMANQNAMRMEMEREQRTAATNTKQESINNAMKAEELNIKRASLASK